MTFVAAVTVPAVAVKLADETPGAIVTEVGTESEALLSEIATLKLLATLADICTVQVEVPPDKIDVGLQEIVLSVGAGANIVTTPPVAVSGNASALAPAALTADTWILRKTVVELDRTTAVTSASTPLAIVPLSTPQTIQLACELAMLQESDFPAATAAAPAVMRIEPSSAELYCKLNPTAAGWLVVEELVMASWSATVEPGKPDPEESARLVVWPYARSDNPKKQRGVKRIERRDKCIMYVRPVRPGTQHTA